MSNNYGGNFRIMRIAKKHWFFIATCLLFITTAVTLVLTVFGHQLNPDATSYFTIAQKYAHGDLRHAINGYWGPLLSWMLVPAVWLGISLTVAGKLVLVLFGCGILATLYWFLESRGVARTVTYFICLAAAIILLPWSVTSGITPDIPLVFFTLLFATIFSSFIAAPTQRLAIILGIIGALLYYTKAFGFYLFIAIVALVALWQWRVSKQSLTRLSKQYTPLIIVFGVLTLPFIGIISVKYHQLTINNAGSYNQHVVGPKSFPMGQPIDYMGQLPPPNDTAISAWEDPTIFTQLLPSWNPLHSRTNLGYFINDIFYTNILTIIRSYASMPVVISAGLLVLWIGCFGRSQYSREYRLFALICGVSIAAYASVFVVQRYLWPTMILGVAGLGLWLGSAVKNKLLTSRQLVAGGLLGCLCLGLITGYSISGQANPNLGVYNTAQKLQPLIPERSKVMSDNFAVSIQTCYYLNLSCYNVMAPPEPKDFPTYHKQLKDLGISYYIDYHTRENDVILQKLTKRYFTKVHTYTSKGVVVTLYKLS